MNEIFISNDGERMRLSRIKKEIAAIYEKEKVGKLTIKENEMLISLIKLANHTSRQILGGG